MIINLEGETEQGREEITLSDKYLNNNNYIDLIIDDKEYTIHLESLYQAVNAFHKTKKL